MSNTTALKSLTGGQPTIAQDVGPSVIFLLLYFIDSALCLYRLLRYRRPPRLLWAFVRVFLFTQIRFATFAVRIAAAVNWRGVEHGTAHLNTSILTAEQILLGIGFLIPASTLLNLLGYHSSREDGGNVREPRKRLIIHLMEVALTVAL
jgi:hypothetical protein